MQLGSLRERCKLTNGVWGKAPAEIEFGAFYPYNMIFGGNSFTNYHAMHYSAKRGIALACRPSVRLSVTESVTLVDQEHIRWNSWKL